MCFSAPASFTAAAVLGATGIATTSKVKTKQEILLAMIPFLFSIQQSAEGILWLSTSGGPTSKIMMYIFLFFAMVIYPTYTPLAVRLIENNKTRRKILNALLIMGILISLYLFYTLVIYQVEYKILGNHIHYFTGDKILPGPYGLALYAAVTAGSCLISSHKWINIFGIGLLLSLPISLYFYISSYGSVWCFFAAALSLVIYLHFHYNKKNFTNKT